MTMPNFFIVGAPKCGTTALYEYLREHPNVFMCTPKEPHYFATDLPKKRLVQTLDEYNHLFDKAGENHKAIGEASVWYLYSDDAIENIKKFNPDAKIIVMLRNPVDFVYSFHSQALQSNTEDVRDFKKAWELSKQRARGREIPKHCNEVKLFYYDQIGKFGFQIDRLLNIFPHEQVKIIFFDDFKKQTGEVYKDVLNFLSLPDDHKSDFPVINKNKRHKIQWLAELTRTPPAAILNLVFKFKKMMGIKELGLKNKIEKINVKTEQRRKLDNEMVEKIIDAYRSDVMKLSKITGRDLIHWLKH